jgi:hypothetical protein
MNQVKHFKNFKKRIKMTSERIKEIQDQTAYPESRSVMLALKQVWNECEQDKTKYTLDDLKEAYSMGRTGKSIRDFNQTFERK